MPNKNNKRLESDALQISPNSLFQNKEDRKLLKRLLRFALTIGTFAMGLAGCATNYDSPRRFVGHPVSDVIATMPRYGIDQGTDDKGRPYFQWKFTETETITISYGTTRQIPGGGPIVSGGLAFRDEQRVRHCSVTAYYDPASMITTEFKVKRPRNAKCRRMGSYLNGSAFLPTDFPG